MFIHFLFHMNKKEVVGTRNEQKFKNINKKKKDIESEM